MRTKPELEDQVKQIEVELKRLKRRDTKRAKDVAEQGKRLKCVDDAGLTALLTQFEGRLNELKRRLEVEILRQTVLSEVARVYPSIALALIAALGRSDDWWWAGRELTIGQWAARVIQQMEAA